MKNTIAKYLFVSFVILGCMRPIISPSLSEVFGPLIYFVPDARVFSDSYFFIQPKIILIDAHNKQIEFLLNYETAKDLIFSSKYSRIQYRLINFAITRPHLLGQDVIEKVIRNSICRDSLLTSKYGLSKLKHLEIHFNDNQLHGISQSNYKVECNI